MSKRGEEVIAVPKSILSTFLYFGNLQSKKLSETLF